MAVTPPRPLRADDDRTRFDCGRESLNSWFRRHAWTNHQSGASRVNVMTDEASGEVIGYVTLSAGRIELAFLSKTGQRNQPEHVPVTLLGQLAVDRRFQGQGHAASLLLFALRTSLQAAQQVGSVGVITHPLDDGVRRLYRGWGFEDLPFDPRRAMMARMRDLSLALGPLDV